MQLLPASRVALETNSRHFEDLRRLATMTVVCICWHWHRVHAGYIAFMCMLVALRLCACWLHCVRVYAGCTMLVCTLACGCPLNVGYTINVLGLDRIIRHYFGLCGVLDSKAGRVEHPSGEFSYRDPAQDRI